MKTIVLLMALLLTGAAFSQSTPNLKPNTYLAVAQSAGLHNSLRDPDSLVVESVWYSNNGKDKDTYCYDYRSRNGFGGMNRSVAYFEVKHKNGGDKVGRWHFSDDPSEVGTFFKHKADTGGCESVSDKNKQNITDQFKAVMPPK